MSAVRKSVFAIGSIPPLRSLCAEHLSYIEIRVVDDVGDGGRGDGRAGKGVHLGEVCADSAAVGRPGGQPGLGKTVGPTVIVILGSCVFRVAWVYTIFAHFHTIPALYLLYPCSWALTAAAEIVYFVFSYRHAALRLQERDALAQL